MYSVFRNLAIIILSAKFFGLVSRKFKAPQVVGEIIAGLLIGPCVLNLVHISDTISVFAEIGVVLLMFSTGLGTNLKELIKAGPIATLIACVGVAVPLLAPNTQVSTTMPMTSSMTAALTMVVPRKLFRCPSSCKVATVMDTLVAVIMVPMKRAR